ncbi:peptidoglycan editing factor PgeF [Acidithiobacillus sp. M4-SHS-6]|uniref:peptidoglycan editing factor PgeF n=1 Tax=Acidithiobacillus sp. M4-SHS-6 TaxID=3383024 RepID=UPI0039BEBD6A
MPADSGAIRIPDWPLPKGVRSAFTLRHGGYSSGPYDSFNLGDHVGDDPEAVAKNRQHLGELLNLPGEPQWLRQVHGTEILQIPTDSPVCSDAAADGAVTHVAGPVLAVLTADCLPVLACSRDGRHLGAFHAGWRGLLAGILEKGVAALGVPGKEVLIYLGPAIGPEAFAVGPELRAAFLAEDPTAASAFRQGQGDRWWADIYQLARQRLQRVAVTAIYGGDRCTFSDGDFFSYRRDGVTGRMASLLWRE